MTRNEFFTRWSKLHGNAKITGIVKAWLNISFLVSKPLARCGVTPNILTILGLVFGVLLYLYAHTYLALIFLVLSLICDGIDGSLAIITGQTSKWGAMLDSTIDRLTEVFWILALFSLGVHINLLIAVLLIASTQEYLRARAGGVGLLEVGVVTVTERPVRASFVLIVLVAFNLNLVILNQIVTVWLVLQLISFLIISKYVRSKLN